MKRANLDGTSLEDVTSTFLLASLDIALDVSGSKTYWTAVQPRTIFFPGAGLVGRANLDGTGAESLINASGPIGIALDVIEGKVYWTENTVVLGPFTSGEPLIRRANLDGTGAEDLVTGLSAPFGIALDAPMPVLPTPVAVGGIAELPEVADASLETGGSSGLGAGVLGGIGGVSAAVIALGGAAWYASRRSLG